MAGLLEFLNTPQGMGLLSGVAGYAAGARRGTPVNNVGRGLTTGLFGYQQAQDAIKQEQENAFQKQYRQMQMDKMQQETARAKGLQDSLQSLYKSAGNVPYKADNPFGEDLGNLQTTQEASFAGKPVDPVLAATIPYAQPDDILKMFGPNNENRTAEQKNWEFAQGLPEDQRAMFMNRSSSSPSTVQEWEYFSKLPAQQQSQYLEMKRNPQIMNLGGAQAVRAPGGGIAESYQVTPKITETPDYQAAQAAAVETAKTGVSQGAETGKKVKGADTLLSYIDRAENILKQGDATGSLIGSGLAATKGALGISDASTQANQQLELVSGWMVANVPRMEGPQSNFDVQNYKTMAAVVGDRTKPINDRMAALQELRGLQEKYKEVQTAPKTSNSGVMSRSEILNMELQGALSSGDTQNARLIRQEMQRMGFKEDKPANRGMSKNADYQEYLDAYRRADTPEKRKAITDRARHNGVVK